VGRLVGSGGASWVGLGLSLGIGLALALGLELGIGIGFRRNHSWSSIFTPRRNHSLSHLITCSRTSRLQRCHNKTLNSSNTNRCVSLKVCVYYILYYVAYSLHYRLIQIFAKQNKTFPFYLLMTSRHAIK